MRSTLLIMAGLAAAIPAAAQGPPSGRPTGILSETGGRRPREPNAWPWSSIGRINVVSGRTRRGFCTGTLVAPDKVVTAAHCLFDQTTGRWAAPSGVHFVAGVARDGFAAHGIARSFVHADGADMRSPGFGRIETGALGQDWAVVTLERPLSLRPVPVKPVPDAAFAAAVAEGEIARAGYGADRPYLLSLQTGCPVAPIAARPGLLAHGCDTMRGDSGSPILLLKGDEAWVIGLATAVSSAFEPEVGHRAQFGIGVSATTFAAHAAGP